MLNSFNCEKCKHIKVCKYKDINENIVRQLKSTTICVEKNTIQNIKDTTNTLVMKCIYFEEL